MEANEQPGMPLPQWQSHKKVWGDRVVEITGGYGTYNWKLACGGVVQVSKKLLSRVPEGVNALGGYYVCYADGFESWSPAKAFEEGYTRI